MSEESLATLLAERACERLVVEFVRRLDLGDPGSVAELFTTDAVWSWPEGDRRIQGRDALRSYFATRPADRLSRRVMTNILVHLDSPDSATATSYLTTYRVDGWTGAMVPAAAPVNVGHYEDALRCVGGQWLLASRTLHLAFGGPTPSLS